MGTFDFTFNIDETPDDNQGSGDDYIYFSSAFPSHNFQIDGVDYTLQLIGFGDSAESIIKKFQSPENSENTTKLWGKITSVPEPATLMLLGIGLIGLAGLVGKERMIMK